MRKFLLAMLASAILLTCLATPRSAYAWHWSSKYNVKVDITFKPTRGTFPINVVDCKKATMSVGGKLYTASVTNPWLSNKCSVSFNGVDVKTSGTYTVKLTYKYYFSDYTKDVYVSLSRPLGATLTRSATVYP